MGHSNYKINDEEKRQLDRAAKILIANLEGFDTAFNFYDEKGEFDNNKFTAFVWYIGDKLSSY